MEQAKGMIDRLRTRVAALVAAHERVKGDLEKRTAERDKLLAEREESERRAEALEQRIRVLELAGGMESLSGGSKAARERVNRLMREVDRCLELMNR
jgi:predicted nuclease with TOPRIM domain